MKMVTVALSGVLAFAACSAADGALAESRLAKKYDAGPAIQGNSDPAMPMHGKKAAKAGIHKKAM